MLKPVRLKSARADGASFAIVASRYNGRYVEAMLRAARFELKRAGAGQVEVFRVPGAYEIPVVVSRLARTGFPRTTRFSAIICLGVILRGETVHAAHIGEAVSRALMELQLRYEVPVVHEVLLLENEPQARARCLTRTHNRGAEAAQTALAMAAVMKQLDASV
jgi:6,7-dimethyl-8-ribityllumazine synthase